MVKRATLLVTSLFVATSLLGCDLGRYPSLGERRDETKVLGSGATTWVAFESTKVTLLTLGAQNGKTPAGFALTELGGAEGDQSLTGTYELGEAPQELMLSATMSYQSDGSTSGAGNTRTSIDEKLAFAYNLVGVPVAAGVLYPVTGTLVSPIWASAAMTFSSVSVITNALRLRRARL